jgi:hypothetical protein
VTCSNMQDVREEYAGLDKDRDIRCTSVKKGNAARVHAGRGNDTGNRSAEIREFG